MGAPSSFCATGSGCPRFLRYRRCPIYKQNNFGVTVGGPVYIPKLYNGKNKTFFFASYEGFRNRVGANTGSFFSVPTPEMYNGDLSATG